MVSTGNTNICFSQCFIMTLPRYRLQKERFNISGLQINTKMNTGPSDASHSTGCQGLVGQSDVLTLSVSSTEMQSLSDNPFRDFD